MNDLRVNLWRKKLKLRWFLNVFLEKKIVSAETNYKKNTQFFYLWIEELYFFLCADDILNVYV